MPFRLGFAPTLSANYAINPNWKASDWSCPDFSNIFVMAADDKNQQLTGLTLGQ
jgi:hypothetical protein